MRHREDLLESKPRQRKQLTSRPWRAGTGKQEQVKTRHNGSLNGSTQRRIDVHASRCSGRRFICGAGRPRRGLLRPAHARRTGVLRCEALHRKRIRGPTRRLNCALSSGSSRRTSFPESITTCCAARPTPIRSTRSFPNKPPTRRPKRGMQNSASRTRGTSAAGSRQRSQLRRNGFSSAGRRVRLTRLSAGRATKG